MSDEEDESASEGFSASEDEWKPNVRHGESSDDDDSDFEELPTAAAVAATERSNSRANKKSEQKSPSGIKGASVKKRKPSGQSLRSKLYNKYRPPPKTFPISTSSQNSPSASGSSRPKASKNAKTPNESDARNNADSSSESSVEDYLVNPADIDLHSSFFTAAPQEKQQQPDVVPQFDCNAGLGNLSDSDSEDNNESSIEEDNNATKAFDFRTLLENANSLERTKEALAAKRSSTTEQTGVENEKKSTVALDVNALLALGENQNHLNETNDVGAKRERKIASNQPIQPAMAMAMDGPSRLNKTKSTRIKRHTKTRPASTVIAAGDTDDSDLEEVADAEPLSSDDATPNVSGDLEIHVGLPTRDANKKSKTQQELEMALKRRLNRDIKERQLLLHKVSLICLIARSYKYNKLLGDSRLMEATLKLLPSKNSYPTQRGCEIKYLQSFATWFKGSIKLASPNLYPEKTARSKQGIVEQLLEQVKAKQARSKQDMIFIFVTLVRAMGMHCRLVVNLQPMSLRPKADALLKIKLKADEPADVKADQSISPGKSERSTKSSKPIKEISKKQPETEPKTVSNTATKAAKSSERTTKVPDKSKAVVGEKKKPETEATRKRVTTRSKSREPSTAPTEKETSSAEKPKLSRLKRPATTTTTTSTSVQPLAEKKSKLEVVTGTPVARRTRGAAKKVIESEVTKIGSPVLPKIALQGARAANNNQGPADNNIKSVASVKANAGVTASSRKKAETVLRIPQLDGAEDMPVTKKRPKLEKLEKSRARNSDDDFEPPSKHPVKKSPVLPKSVQNLRKDRRVLSTDDEKEEQRNSTASDMWPEVWSEVEEQWICIDLFKGKIHCVDSIRRGASSNLAYVFAFQDDLSVKDVTARYCSNWTTLVRKGRVEKAWLDETLIPYLGRRTKRDIIEDQQLRRIHEEKPMPTAIGDFKDHPLYALERHLLKFQGLYPPDAPTLGFIRGEAIYARECVHLLHSRDIWLKQARVVKLGEQPYKIVKARPKWDKLTRSVIKDQPLEIFGYWQTQDYDPPTAENGIVPRNAYGNVELFKECMLPKKTVHLRLPGLMRICKKLNIDCANAVIGFDFHQGACHPLMDGFVVCEEFEEIVTAAWEQDQVEQTRKEQEKYEARVYGNWKKLIRGLQIREHLKRKYQVK